MTERTKVVNDLKKREEEKSNFAIKEVAKRRKWNETNEKEEEEEEEEKEKEKEVNGRTSHKSLPNSSNTNPR